MEASKHTTLGRRRGFREVYRHKRGKRTKSRSLEDANHDEHGDMHTSSCQCSTNYGNERCGEESPFSSNFVCQRPSAEGANTCSKEEESIDSTNDVVGICCARPSCRKIEVLEESRLTDAGGERSKPFEM